jgi:hypothetical protein
MQMQIKMDPDPVQIHKLEECNANRYGSGISNPDQQILMQTPYLHWIRKYTTDPLLWNLGILSLKPMHV